MEKVIDNGPNMKFIDQLANLEHLTGDAPCRAPVGGSLFRDKPSTQLFVVTRAPEAEPFSDIELKRMIARMRKDSEWDVKELDGDLNVVKANEKNQGRVPR